MESDTFNIVIGGEAGQGLLTMGQLLSKSLVRSGYFIVVTRTTRTGYTVVTTPSLYVPVSNRWQPRRNPLTFWWPWTLTRSGYTVTACHPWGLWWLMKPLTFRMTDVFRYP